MIQIRPANLVGIQFPASRSGRLSRILSAFVAAVLILTGCDSADPIRQYTVDKPPAPKKAPFPEREAPRRPMDERPSTKPAGPATDCILAAVVPDGKQAWFFKIQGPIEEARSAIPDFVSFISSLAFRAGNAVEVGERASESVPKWELPDGWKIAKNPAGKGRFATLSLVAAGTPMELTVIPLTLPPGDFDSYLISNINRWCNQLQRGPLEPGEFEQIVQPLKLEDKHNAWLVLIEGWSPESTPRNGKPSQGPKSNGKPKLPFEYKVPEHWVPGELNQFRIAAWDVVDGKEKVTITISQAGGSVVDNVIRWRGIVKLPPANKKEIEDSMQTITMGSATGKYVQLVAPETEKLPQTLLGVIVPVQGDQWFFKLQGDVKLAERERRHFESFINSVKFP